jgi:hypothetical protein
MRYAKAPLSTTPMKTVHSSLLATPASEAAIVHSDIFYLFAISCKPDIDSGAFH